MTTRDEQFPDDPAEQAPGDPAEQVPGDPAEQAPGDPAEQLPVEHGDEGGGAGKETLAERLMHGDSVAADAEDRPDDAPGEPRGDLAGKPHTAERESRRTSAVDPGHDADESAEETRVIADEESATEETRVIPEEESAAEETRVIPTDESATERTAVLPPPEREPAAATRTDLAADDEPRRRPARRDPEAAGSAGAGAATGAAAGAAATPTEVDAERDAKPTKPPRTTDRPLGAFALFVLRIVTAGIFGVHGVQKLLDIPGTREFFGSFPLPQAELFGLLTAAGELAIALGLLLGLAVRIAGLGAMIVAIGALVLVRWTEWPIAGSPAGFSGELELLLAAVGFVFLLLGGGRIGLDRMFRRNP